MPEFKLKFDEKLCATCPTYDCLVKCQYMEVDKDAAKVEMNRMLRGEDSLVLHQCVTCYACEEYCRRGNHPFYFITDLQEKKGILPMPKPLSYSGAIWVYQQERIFNDSGELRNR